MNYVLNLTQENVQIIMKAMEEAPLPLKYTYPLIMEINNQIKAQDEAQKNAIEAANKALDNPEVMVVNPPVEVVSEPTLTS